MKLLNSLYSIIREDVHLQPIQYEIKLNPSHLIYKAHFPNEPITPGVCIIQIAKELLEDTIKESLVISGVKNVKFLNVISPIANPNVIYEFEKIVVNEDESGYRAQILVKSTEGLLAKLSFLCKKL